MTSNNLSPADVMALVAVGLDGVAAVGLKLAKRAVVLLLRLGQRYFAKPTNLMLVLY
eukprot:m.146885 g.146885  ORF g.146885 m.146885 type:complete len:57 (+) comp16097_c0_seq2:340-510(+)